MLKNEFNRPVARDSVPRGSGCEWCGKPAEQQLTVTGGVRHNTGGIFCRSCGEQFSQATVQPGSGQLETDRKESTMTLLAGERTSQIDVSTLTNQLSVDHYLEPLFVRMHPLLWDHLSGQA